MFKAYMYREDGDATRRLISSLLFIFCDKFGVLTARLLNGPRQPKRRL